MLISCLTRTLKSFMIDLNFLPRITSWVSDEIYSQCTDILSGSIVEKIQVKVHLRWFSIQVRLVEETCALSTPHNRSWIFILGTRVGEPPPDGLTGFNSGVLLLDLDQMRKSKLYNSLITADAVKSLSEEFHFKGHLGDQDFFTLLNMKYEKLFHVLPCEWNRQLCRWWEKHGGYNDVFHLYFNCDAPVKIYHGNCNTPIPQDWICKWCKNLWCVIFSTFSGCRSLDTCCIWNTHTFIRFENNSGN